MFEKLKRWCPYTSDEKVDYSKIEAFRTCTKPKEEWPNTKEEPKKEAAVPILLREIIAEVVNIPEGEHIGVVSGYSFGMTRGSGRPFARIVVQSGEHIVLVFASYSFHLQPILKYALNNMLGRKVKIKTRNVSHRDEFYVKADIMEVLSDG